MIVPTRRRYGVLLLAAVFLAGCGRQPPPDEPLPVAPVKWHEAVSLVLDEWTELVGTTMPLPDRVARISAPVEGRVVSVLLDREGKPVIEGQHVEAGTVLVQLDSTIIDANLDRAVASFHVLEQDEEQANIAVKRAQLDVDLLEEAKRTGQRGSLTGPSEAQIKIAAMALETARSQVRGAVAKKKAGEKDVKALEAQHKLYTIATPIKGRLGRILVVQGQTVPAGTPVAEVVDVEDQIDVLCFVSSQVARQLALGQKVRMGGIEEANDGAEQEDKVGKVEFIAPQAESDTGNIAVKVRFPNRALRLQTNTTKRISVLTRPGEAGKPCFTLPETALMEDSDPPTVVVVEDVKVQPKKDDKGEIMKNDKGEVIEETTGKARVLQVEIGRRNRLFHQVEIIRLIDPEKDPEKRWKGTLETALFVVEKGAGLQTGDLIKLEQDED